MKLLQSTTALLILACLAIIPAVWAERGDDANRKSKNGETSAVIDGVQVAVEYGRPTVKDRKIWGGLVPYDRVWRTGADEATTVSFDGNVVIEGQPLPAGRYGLFTIPGMDSWTFIFNNTPDQWGAFSYDETEDALRVRVTPSMGDHVEELTFAVEGSAVMLRWEKLAVGFEVEAAD